MKLTSTYVLSLNIDAHKLWEDGENIRYFLCYELGKLVYCLLTFQNIFHFCSICWCSSGLASRWRSGNLILRCFRLLQSPHRHSLWVQTQFALVSWLQNSRSFILRSRSLRLVSELVKQFKILRTAVSSCLPKYWTMESVP